MKKYSIREIEKLTGIKSHTLRIWEQRYDLLKPERTDTNIRFYTDKHLQKLLNISQLIKQGMRISKIARLSDEELHNRVEELHKGEFDDNSFLVNSLVQAMVAMDERSMERIIMNSFVQRGVLGTFEFLLFPFLRTTGMLWQTEQIMPAQEHFASCLIRKKLISVIDSQPWPNDTGKKALLFLPMNEYHELPLLLYNYVLISKGIPLFYLGASVPFDNINAIWGKQGARCLVTHVTMLYTDERIIDYLNDLEETCPNTPIMIGGCAHRSIKPPSSLITFLPDDARVAEKLSQV